MPIVTAAATSGEMNIAIKIDTWLANVNDAGSNRIFIGENIGIIIPTAISKLDIVKSRVVSPFKVSPPIIRLALLNRFKINMSESLSFSGVFQILTVIVCKFSLKTPILKYNVYV